MTSEALVKMQKAVNTGGGKQERNRKPRRIHCKQQNTAQNCLTIRGKNKDSGENRTDAWRPAESKCKPEQETARDACKRPALLAFSFGSATEIVKTNITIQPACHGWSSKKNQSNRKQLHRSKKPRRTEGFGAEATPSEHRRKRQD